MQPLSEKTYHFNTAPPVQTVNNSTPTVVTVLPSKDLLSRNIHKTRSNIFQIIDTTN